MRKTWNCGKFFPENQERMLSSSYNKIGDWMCSFEVRPHFRIEIDPFCEGHFISRLTTTCNTDGNIMVTVSDEDHLEVSLAIQALK